MNKRILAVGHRSGTRWVMRTQESSAILPVTRAGIERGLEKVFGVQHEYTPVHRTKTSL